MIPLVVLGGTPEPGCDESRWMNELFSMSNRSGEPLTEASAPTPAPASVKPVTSCVLTNPPEPGSNLKTTPLPLMTVRSPPPPPLPATPFVQEPGVGPEYAAKDPPPWPIHTPAVSPGQELGKPPVQRSKSAAFSLPWSIPVAVYPAPVATLTGATPVM